MSRQEIGRIRRDALRLSGHPCCVEACADVRDVFGRADGQVEFFGIAGGERFSGGQNKEELSLFHETRV